MQKVKFTAARNPTVDTPKPRAIEKWQGSILSYEPGPRLLSQFVGNSRIKAWQPGIPWGLHRFVCDVFRQTCGVGEL